jgi:predicted Zn-dependent protease
LLIFAPLKFIFKMKKLKYLIVALAIPVAIYISGCNKEENGGGGFNIFTVDDDIALGQDLHQEIVNDPANYPMLSQSQYPEAYQHMRRVRDSLLNTGEVAYDDVFVWDVTIIRNDTVLNAFCTPGGYIYFYTGLIKFLDNEAEFAGVMGHEMAHAARRHSTEQLTKAYGLQVLINLVLGQNPSLLAQIAADLAAGLTALAFSRNDEYEADEYAVKYTYPTAYDARGVAGFFEKLDGSSYPPEFLSTHPNPGNRVDAINNYWLELGGKEGEWFEQRYTDFKNSLP